MQARLVVGVDENGLGPLLGPLVVKLAGAPAMGLLGALLCSLALALVAALPKGLKTTRPATDYTARVIPNCNGVAIPLEDPRILWQR